MKKRITNTFFISVFLTFVTAMLGTVSTIEYGDMTVLEFIVSGKTENPDCPSSFAGLSYALTGTWFSILIPLLVSLPKIFPFSDCIQSGFWRFNIIRSGRKKFSISCWLSIILNGALSVAAGYFLYSLIIILTFMQSSDKSIYANNPLCSLLGLESIWGVLFFKLLIVFIFSAMTASICITLYVITENKYKSIGMPIIIYYILSSLSESIFRKTGNMKTYIISPQNLIGSSDFWFESTFNVSFWLIPAVMLAITIFLCIIYSELMKRRLSV